MTRAPDRMLWTAVVIGVVAAAVVRRAWGRR